MLSPFQLKRLAELEAQKGFEYFCLDVRESHTPDDPETKGYHGPVTVLYYMNGELWLEKLGQLRTRVVVPPKRLRTGAI